jgi:methylated-DNA-[protein]-cysteine S-methyltransferase
MRIECAEIRSPIGPLTAAVSEAGLCALERRFGAFVWLEAADPGGVASALGRYFAGELDALDAIAIDLDGTPFQREVWLALRRIPAGGTWSYSDLARAVSRPQAVRAVGAANGANPLPLVLPCHRVIGSSGRLTGYGGGLDRKEWLLRHEGAAFVPEPPPRPTARSLFDTGP